jgi:exopolyphosphatase/guanosine-5'-triphosphate,3'-diphosphate pyrophosphatase
MMQPTSRTPLKTTPSYHAESPWAALDLGSNSFHLLLARPVGASFVIVERLKEKVQLLAGFNAGRIQLEAEQRGLGCLARFAQRLSSVDPARIKVMGTYALRQADNAAEFTAAAQRVLGVPVDVIDGEYEARLIYTAVAHQASHDTDPRLVIDIGGGSTEFAVGTGMDVGAAESVNIGCVSCKDLHFNTGMLQSIGYPAAKQMAIAALTESLRTGAVQQTISRWSNYSVFGTSGTIESIQTVLAANGWSRGAITAEAMARLEAAIVEDRWVIEAGLPGLAPDRADIFPAGVAILSACFEVLNIERLEHVDVSLLQGIMCENLVADVEADLREDSVVQLARRFSADSAQAERVRKCAADLFRQSASWWNGDEECEDLLRWAATLHELGVQISARHYHRHGAYIVKHAELPGFSSHLQSVLALLIRGHRRSMPGLAFQAFDPQLAHKLLRLVGLLRLAVILQRSHSDADSPQPLLTVDDNEVQLDCGNGWLAAHPLSHRELIVEQRQQATAGIQLTLLS